MSYQKRLDAAFEQVPVLPLGEHDKYVLFSDCHRGNGTHNDNFLKNEHLYLAALRHYNRLGYTYIELGDGDELWENRKMEQITEIHSEVFAKLSQFYRAHRPMADPDVSPYLNTGSCVHPYQITCIEIEQDAITLVKWYMDARSSGSLYVERSCLNPQAGQYRNSTNHIL